MNTKITSSHRIKHLIINEIKTGQWLYCFVGFFFIAFFIAGFSRDILSILPIVAFMGRVSLFQDSAKLSEYLLIPASTKEKFSALAIAWFIVFPIISFIVCYAGVFLGLKILGKNIDFNSLWVDIFVFYFFQALLFETYTRFKKHALLKFFVVLASFVIIFLLIYTLLKTSDFFYAINESSDCLFKNCFIGFSIFSVIILWITSYFNFKKQEVY